MARQSFLQLKQAARWFEFEAWGVGELAEQCVRPGRRTSHIEDAVAQLLPKKISTVKLVIATGREDLFKEISKFMCKVGLAYYGYVSADVGFEKVVQELKELRSEVNKLRIVQEQRRDLINMKGDNKAARVNTPSWFKILTNLNNAANTPSWFKILTDLNNAASEDSEYTSSLNASFVAKHIVLGGEGTKDTS